MEYDKAFPPLIISEDEVEDMGPVLSDGEREIYVYVMREVEEGEWQRQFLQEDRIYTRLFAMSPWLLSIVKELVMRLPLCSCSNIYIRRGKRDPSCERHSVYPFSEDEIEDITKKLSWIAEEYLQNE